MKVRRVDFYGDDWLAGTMELTDTECGLYIRACSLIYARNAPINVDLLKSASDSHGNKFNYMLDKLVSLGKLDRNGNELSSKRCRNELDRASKRLQSSIDSAAKSSEIRALRRADAQIRQRANIQHTTYNSKKEETPSGVSKKERGCRIDGWVVSKRGAIDCGKDTRLHANLPAIDLDLEWDKFQDYWRAKSGKDGIKLDWLATWRNWCRNARGVPIASNQEPDELTPEMKEAIAKAPPGSSVDDKMWCFRLQRYLKDGSWLPTYYGPPPDDPFSRVPHAILTVFGLAAKGGLQ